MDIIVITCISIAFLLVFSGIRSALNRIASALENLNRVSNPKQNETEK